MTFRIVFGPATDCAEPTARNSNLFPVNANGDVLLRSVVSFENVGTTATPVLNLSLVTSLFKVLIYVFKRPAQKRLSLYISY